MVIADRLIGLACADLNSCAAMSGVPGEVVQRAEDLVLLSMRGEDLIAACCQMPDEESAELEEAVSTMPNLGEHALTLGVGTNSEGVSQSRCSRRSERLAGDDLVDAD